jgi:hypothetical protein
MVKVSFVDVVIATPSGAWAPLTSNNSGESAVAGATSHIAGARSHRACTHGENQRRFSQGFTFGEPDPVAARMRKRDRMSRLDRLLVVRPLVAVSSRSRNDFIERRTSKKEMSIRMCERIHESKVRIDADVDQIMVGGLAGACAIRRTTSSHDLLEARWKSHSAFR